MANHDTEGVVISYLAGAEFKHSRVTRTTEGAYMLDNKPLTAATSPTLPEAVTAAVGVISARVGKPIFPVRNPAAMQSGGPAGNPSNGYVNTSYEVMAAALSELPVMDRFQAERKVGEAGTDGGFLLRQQTGGPTDDKVVISCLTKGAVRVCLQCV
jgi:hypothetical protein